MPNIIESGDWKGEILLDSIEALDNCIEAVEMISPDEYQDIEPIMCITR